MTAYSRTLQGQQPVLAPVDYADPTVSYADLRVYYTGKSPGLISLVVVASRSPGGVQPASNGSLTHHYVGSRSLTGSQPISGALTGRRWVTSLPAFHGVQPAATGTLIARRAIKVPLFGFQPVFLDVAYADPTITYADLHTFYTGRSPGRLSYVAAGLHHILLRGRQPSGLQGRLTLGPNHFRRLLVGRQTISGTLRWLRVWYAHVLPGHGQGTTPDQYVHQQREMGRRYVHRQTGATKIEHRIR